MSKSRRNQRNQKSFLNEVSDKESRGAQQQVILNHNKYQKYDLDWFKPRGRQVEIMDADRQQTYAIKKRKDGFSDFIDKVTEVDEDGRYSIEPLFKYVKLTTNENQRGAISKRVTELYSIE